MLPVTVDALPPGTDMCAAFAGWLCQSRSAPDGARLLNVGAGSGIGPCAPLVARLFSEVVGVDPNPQVAANPSLSDYWVGTVEDFANTYAGRPFDTACSIYVVEHVEDPVSFLSAVKQTLVPGGYFYSLTPNLYHYFALAARMAARLGVEKAILHWVLEPQFVDEYHHETHYRLNTVRQVRRSAMAAGYSSLDILYLDNPEILQPYFSRFLPTFPETYSRWVHKHDFYSLFATMLYRLRT